MLRRIVFFVLLMGCVATASASMQEADWSAYLYNSPQNLLQRVSDGGETVDVSLPVPNGAFVGARDLSFSPDGSIVAFCAISNEASGSRGNLTVYDLANSQMLLQREVGEAFSCRATFSESGGQVALMTLRNATEPNTPPTWSIDVLDVATGSVDATLEASELVEAQDWERAWSLPVVRQFAGSDVTFGLFPLGEGPAEVPAYRWSLVDDTLAPASGWGHLFYAYLSSTGEMAFAQEDPTLPMGNAGGPMPSSNVVRIQNADGSLQTVFTSGADWVIGSLAFTDSGRALAIQLIQSYDFENPEMVQQTRWVLLDRSGAVSDVQVVADFIDLRGATDGYAALTGDNLNGQGMPEITLSRMAEGNAQVLWSATQNEPGMYWELSWSTPMVEASDLAPFPGI